MSDENNNSYTKHIFSLTKKEKKVRNEKYYLRAVRKEKATKEKNGEETGSTKTKKEGIHAENFFDVLSFLFLFSQEDCVS